MLKDPYVDCQENLPRACNKISYLPELRVSKFASFAKQTCLAGCAYVRL